VKDHGYILATGDRAVDRLNLLDEIFRPYTRELLARAGLREAMKVVDIGCGTGLVALWIATQVGPNGSVTAVDQSAEQLKIAEKNAARAGLRNISFHQATAYETGLEREEFHLVYSRFLLCHLTEPAKALSEMRSLLRSGGILVCEDHDDGGIFSEPETAAYKRLVEISKAVNRSRGLDSYVGLKLPRLFQQTGFSKPEVMIKQIAHLRGPAKRFWEVTLREVATAIIEAGAATKVELDALCGEIGSIADDETTLVMLARVTQVWAGVTAA
jgi:ubiquinone/menaquinone biosynthesis C-methylase UbiE